MLRSFSLLLSTLTQDPSPVQIEVGQDQTVRWLVIGMGTENDLHTPIFFNQVRARSPCHHT